MTRILPRLTALAACGALVLALAACAGPDPEVVTKSAEALFAELVDATGELDAQTLRTLEVSPPAEVACPDRDEALQRAYVATGTLAIEGEESDVADVFDTVGDRLDAERWDAIGTDRDLTQRAWADDDGIVVSVTAAGSIVTVAVFTPCLA